ncbi:MAG: hypothetical protein K2J85_00860, partial [Anaeroplasmataceae bacterium]|nr:hypothetical protein [Anaeroplasmataceae bacterium]
DKTFKRNGKTGTDIFILGFKNPAGWKEDIISKFLESFISAIAFDDLEVVVDDVLINKETLKDIVYDEALINKPNRKSIISQYLLLTDEEHRYEDVIDFGRLGVAKLYLREFDIENENLATNGCVMIRYPLMKIRDIEKITTLPCSAMCIIENNELNALLRSVENPQHTNWEFNRIEDDKIREKVRYIYKQLLDGIRRIITEHLSSSDNFQTDMAGAGNFIPGSEGGFDSEQETIEKTILDKPSISTKKVKSTELKMTVYEADENGDELLDIEEENEDDIPIAEIERHSPSEKKTGTSKGKESSKGTTSHSLGRFSELKGMSYRLMCLNKKMRMYAIVFTSSFEESEVLLELYALDDSGAKSQVLIFACTLNGVPAQIVGRSKVKFSIKDGQKIKLEMITNQTELFSSEVKVYACR